MGRASNHLTTLTLESIGQVYDLNLSAARVMLQMHARAASVLGWPDWSGLFGTVDDRARHVFSVGAEQFANTAQRANEAAAELQQEVSRVVGTQAATVAQTLEQGLEELGTQASAGIEQFVKTARQQAEEAERVASVVGERLRGEMQQALQATGEVIERAVSEGERATQETGEEKARRKAA
jgi:hypothetical protein